LSTSSTLEGDDTYQNERCLIGLYGSVYDVGDFLEFHPGSKETILDNAGGDATALFEDVGHSNIARKLMPPLLVIQTPPMLTKDTGVKNLVDIQQSGTSSLKKKRQRKLSLCVCENRVGKKMKDRALNTASRKYSRVTTAAASEVVENMAPPSSPSSPSHHDDVNRSFCESRGEHAGVCRVYYDPFSMKWGCWWTCCSAVVSDI